MSSPVVHTLDLRFRDTPELIAAFLIDTGGDLCLIETGPGSTLPALLQGIRQAGYDPAQVRHVLVTHVHLDHAGAAGWWASQGATIYAHPRAVPHLLNPSKLMDSARLVYGDTMERLWGEMWPVPEAQLVALQDQETLRVGQCVITALDTPGHARHHHAYALGAVCFTGDVAGMRLPGLDYISVTSAPPQFDPPAYLESLQRLRAHQFSQLYLTHFGPVNAVEDHLAAYSQRVQQVDAFMRGLQERGVPEEAWRAAYTQEEARIAQSVGVSAADWERYERGNPTWMGADGMALYLKKQGPRP